MSGGLSLYSPRLAAACDSAGEPGLRTMAEIGARIAVSETGLASPAVNDAVAALLAGRFGPGPVRDSLAAFVAELDSEAFDLEDAIADGQATEDEYLVVFQRARSATSLMWSLHEDAKTAAGNALYEAIAALGEDPRRLEDALLAARDG